MPPDFETLLALDLLVIATRSLSGTCSSALTPKALHGQVVERAERRSVRATTVYAQRQEWRPSPSNVPLRGTVLARTAGASGTRYSVPPSSECCSVGRMVTSEATGMPPCGRHPVIGCTERRRSLALTPRYAPPDDAARRCRLPVVAVRARKSGRDTAPTVAAVASHSRAASARPYRRYFVAHSLHRGLHNDAERRSCSRPAHPDNTLHDWPIGRGRFLEGRCRRIRGVIFDMDGTITVPALDFPRMKAAMGLPQDKAILEALEDLSPAARAEAEEIASRVRARGRRE